MISYERFCSHIERLSDWGANKFWIESKYNSVLLSTDLGENIQIAGNGSVKTFTSGYAHLYRPISTSQQECEYRINQMIKKFNAMLKRYRLENEA